VKKIIFALALLGAGFFMLHASQQADAMNGRVSQSGLVTLSEPVASYNEWVKPRGGTSFNMGISFTTQKGEKVRGNRDISSVFARGFKPGMQVKIRYLPEDPQQFVIVGEEEAGLSLTRLAAFLLLGWGTLLLLGSLIIKNKTVRRLG
jgi:hypothetical protein